MIAQTVQTALAAALNCATGVDPTQTAVSIARAESELDPQVVHDNTVGMSYAPRRQTKPSRSPRGAGEVLPAQTSPVSSS